MPSVREQVAKCLLDMAGNADVYCRAGSLSNPGVLCARPCQALRNLRSTVAPCPGCRKVTEPLFVAAVLTRIFCSDSEIRRQTANSGPARVSTVPSFFAPFARQSRIDSKRKAFRRHSVEQATCLVQTQNLFSLPFVCQRRRAPRQEKQRAAEKDRELPAPLVDRATAESIRPMLAAARVMFKCPWSALIKEWMS